jgi:hypothetical protein
VPEITGNGTRAVEAWFLGPKGENADVLERLISEAIRDQAFWRRNYHPGDPLRSPLRIPRLQRPARTHRHPCSAFTRLRRFACRLSAYRAEGAAGAEGAREGSQGQGRAERARSPWIALIKFCRPAFFETIQGLRAFALAPGYLMPRLRRSAHHAPTLRSPCAWLPYSPPSALSDPRLKSRTKISLVKHFLQTFITT